MNKHSSNLWLSTQKKWRDRVGHERMAPVSPVLLQWVEDPTCPYTPEVNRYTGLSGCVSGNEHSKCICLYLWYLCILWLHCALHILWRRHVLKEVCVHARM